MKNSTAGVLEVIEAIYRDEKSDSAWVRGILDAARPVIDQGLGVVAFPFEATAREIRITNVKVLDAPSGVGPTLVKSVMATARDDSEVSTAYRTQPCGTGSEVGLTTKHGFEMLRRKGVHDCLAVNGVDTTGHGIFLGSFMREEGGVAPAVRARFAKIAAHLGVGQRYHRLSKRKSRVEAIFDAGAKLVHAEGEATKTEARETLKRAVVALDRARGRQRRTDPDGALDAWKGLVDARWSLVDQFESDGKRFVVARENEPTALPLPNLSKRERQIVGYLAIGHTSKLIAYELGVSDATVRVLIHRAMQKTSVDSRQGLVTAFFQTIASMSPPATAASNDD